MKWMRSSFWPCRYYFHIRTNAIAADRMLKTARFGEERGKAKEVGAGLLEVDVPVPLELELELEEEDVPFVHATSEEIFALSLSVRSAHCCEL